MITGSEGQLGKSLKNLSKNYNYRFFFMSKSELDISNNLKLEYFLKKFKVNTIINCAAYTNVDDAELNKEIANNINNISVKNIARLCEKLNIQLIHISTDYVFDGKKKTPYTETDKTNPVNYYGKTKLYGEEEILNSKLSNSAIIRTSWLYSAYENNFVSKILHIIRNKNKVKVVNDEIGSPTNASDLSAVILNIIPKLKNSKAQIYHYSNLGSCSRLEFVKMIIHLIESKTEVINYTKKNKKILRPEYSVLDSTKIMRNFKIEIKNWSESLKDFIILNNYNYNDEF